MTLPLIHVLPLSIHHSQFLLRLTSQQLMHWKENYHKLTTLVQTLHGQLISTMDQHWWVVSQLIQSRKLDLDTDYHQSMSLLMMCFVDKLQKILRPTHHTL